MIGPELDTKESRSRGRFRTLMEVNHPETLTKMEWKDWVDLAKIVSSTSETIGSRCASKLRPTRKKKYKYDSANMYQTLSSL